jgi:hypothetical protein
MYKRYKDIQIKYTNVSETNNSQACPNSTYTIGPPSLATITQALKNQKK